MAKSTGGKAGSRKQVEALKHDDASRKNIPTAEYQSLIEKESQSPIQVAYERRNRDLDPQLVWRGKDEQDWSDLVQALPLGDSLQVMASRAEREEPRYDMME